MAAAPRVLAALLAVGCAVSGCTKAAQPGSSGSAPASSAPASSASSTVAAPATPAGPPSLGGRCDDLLDLSVVGEALGRPVIGRTSFIVGVAEPNIGRLTYLNCQYGLANPVKGKPAPQPQLEIGVSLYDSAAQAGTRVRGTVQDYQSHGARPIQVMVGSTPATILVDYGNPTLVVAAGPRTVAVTADPKLIAAGAGPRGNLVAVAQAALTATANFTGVPGVTATPSASPSDSGTDSAVIAPSPTDTSS